MRKNLKKLLDKKVTIEADFERYGLKSNYIGGDTITMLLGNIEIVGEDEKTDHCWVNVGKTLATVDVPEGSRIRFNAWVKTYYKGYINYEEGLDEKTMDIGINRVSKISIINSSNGKTFRGFMNEMRKKNFFISNKY